MKSAYTNQSGHINIKTSLKWALFQSLLDRHSNLMSCFYQDHRSSHVPFPVSLSPHSSNHNKYATIHVTYQKSTSQARGHEDPWHTSNAKHMREEKERERERDLTGESFMEPLGQVGLRGGICKCNPCTAELLIRHCMGSLRRTGSDSGAKRNRRKAWGLAEISAGQAKRGTSGISPEHSLTSLTIQGIPIFQNSSFESQPD